MNQPEASSLQGRWPGVNFIKLFFLFVADFSKKVLVFVPDISFQVVIIFPIDEPTIISTSQCRILWVENNFPRRIIMLAYFAQTSVTEKKKVLCR